MRGNTTHCTLGISRQAHLPPLHAAGIQQQQAAGQVILPEVILQVEAADGAAGAGGAHPECGRAVGDQRDQILMRRACRMATE